MADTLGDVHVVDLKHSEWDREKSSPKKGHYVFTKKAYVDYSDKGRRPDVFLTWERWDPSNGYREFNQAKAKFGASHVLSGEELFWPEGVPPDGEGKYVYGDSVLIQFPLLTELKRRAVARDMANRGARAKLDQFKGQMKQSGSDIPESLIDEMLAVD